MVATAAPFSRTKKESALVSPWVMMAAPAATVI
jgi:hypothetical protein